MPCLHNKFHLLYEVYLCPVSVQIFAYIMRYIYALSPYQSPSTTLHNSIIQRRHTKRQCTRSCLSPSRCRHFSRRNVTEPVRIFLQDLLSLHHLGNTELQTLVASLDHQISCPPFCTYCLQVVFAVIKCPFTQHVNILFCAPCFK